MQAIESFEHLYQAVESLVTAHTSLDRRESADAIALALAGHPREAAIKLLLDGLCAGSHNLAGRLAAAAEIKELVHKYDAPEPVAVGPVSAEGTAGTTEPLTIETVHYADGSSATGVAPLPDHSPEGAPAIEAPPVAVPVTGDTTADPETAKILDAGVVPVEPEVIPNEAPAGPEVPHVADTLQE